MGIYYQHHATACSSLLFVFLILLGTSLAQSNTSNIATDCSNSLLTNSNIPLAVQSWLQGGDARDIVVSQYGPIPAWDTSCVTDLSQLFRWTSTGFAEDLSLWNTARVTRLDGLLEMTTQFRGNLSGWDTSGVASMTRIGHRSSGLNATAVGMSGWDTAKVTDLGHAFEASLGFAGDLRGWNTKSVTNLERLFVDSNAFAGDVSGWNLEQVTRMDYAFAQSKQFRGYIHDWKVRDVQSMPFLFADAVDFVPLDYDTRPMTKLNWDTAQVTDLSFALQGTSNFNTDLVASWTTDSLTELRLAFAKSTNLHGTQPGQWTTTNVSNMMGLFASTANFTSRLIANFDTSSVHDMNAMFKYSRDFQGDIANWNTGHVRNLEEFAQESNAFQGDLSQWNVSRVTSMKDAFGGARNMPAQSLVSWNTERVRNMFRIFAGTDWGLVDSHTAVEDWPIKLCWNVDSVAYTYLDSFTCTTTPDVGLDCACLDNDDLMEVINDACFESRPPCLGDIVEEEGVAIVDTASTPSSTENSVNTDTSDGFPPPFSASSPFLRKGCASFQVLGFATTTIAASWIIS